MSRTYSELIKLSTFKDRFNYLKTNSKVGDETFGHDRYLNQKFYTSAEWRTFRNHIIVRDNGCDLGIDDRPIQGHITIHHIEPITKADILNRDKKVLDPDNVICVSDLTHKAIHYGSENILIEDAFVERSKGDTKLW